MQSTVKEEPVESGRYERGPVELELINSDLSELDIVYTKPVKPEKAELYLVKSEKIEIEIGKYDKIDIVKSEETEIDFVKSEKIELDIVKAEEIELDIVKSDSNEMDRYVMVDPLPAVLCDECGQTFQKRYELQRHKRSCNVTRDMSDEAAHDITTKPTLHTNSHCDTQDDVYNYKSIEESATPAEHSSETLIEVSLNSAIQSFLDSQTLFKKSETNSQATPKTYKISPNSNVLSEPCNSNKTEKEKYFHCNVCPSLYTDIELLAQHVTGHSDIKPFVCNQCYRCYETRAKLKIHFGKYHQRPKKFQCNFCKSYLISKKNLIVHIRTHADNQDKIYVCSVCAKRFAHSCSLKRHERIHSGERPYECNVCNKNFIQSKELNRHLRIHTGEKPYKCNICDKCFNEKGAMKKHQRTHSGEKPYKCDTCNKSFAHSHRLKTHKFMHSGEKPYTCDICLKSFTRISSLKTHQRIHSGDKPYNCYTCHKSFNDISNFKKHQRVHSSEQPYQCITCNKSFNRIGNLKTHQRIHSSDSDSLFIS